MRKDKLIEYLMADSEFDKKELSKMRVAELQTLFDERYDIEYFDNNEDESKDEEDLDHVNVVYEAKDDLGNEDLDEEDEDLDEEDEDLDEDLDEEDIVEIVIDINKLSSYERRTYLRTGILPKMTYNRYTRFDSESPKYNN